MVVMGELDGDAWTSTIRTRGVAVLAARSHRSSSLPRIYHEETEGLPPYDIRRWLVSILLGPTLSTR